jgi:hypothetical protein
VTLVIDASLTLSWYFDVELARRRGLPLGTGDRAMSAAARALAIDVLG